MINISFEEIKKLIKIDDLFEPVKQAFIDYNSPDLIGIPVNLLHFADQADAHIKIAAINGYDYFSIKVATMFPNNATRDLPPYNGAVFLFDAKTGIPKAVLNDKGLLTDLRTAAAGAVITHFVASTSADTVGVIGTGIQAYQQIFALAKLRPITKLNIYGRNEHNARLLKQKIKKTLPDTSINIVNTPEQAVKTSQIIITTTPSKTPLVKGEWLNKEHHITAVGADDTFKQEIDDDCFLLADHIFIDSMELNQQYGEYAHAIKKDATVVNKTTEFGKAFLNDNQKQLNNRITIAKLVGLGVQDLAAATVVMNSFTDKY